MVENVMKVDYATSRSKMTHQSRKQRHGRKCNIKEGNVTKIENAIHQSRKCNIKIENVIKVENATSMFITQSREE